LVKIHWVLLIKQESRFRSLSEASTCPSGVRVSPLVLANIDGFANVAIFRETCGKSWRPTIQGHDLCHRSLLILIVFENELYFIRRVAKVDVYASWVAIFVTGHC